MRHVSLVVLSLATSALLLACAGNDGATATTGTTPTNTNPDPKSDPTGAVDPVADPVPSDIGELKAFATSDVAPDLSCFGTAMPVSRGSMGDREFHLIALGGDDSERISGVAVELFLGNKVNGAMPDASVMSPKDDDATKTGLFHAKAHAGWIGYRIAASDGTLPIVGLDLDVPDSGPVLPAAPTKDKVDALSILIGGASYTPVAGAGRVVVRAVDCQGHPLVNAHVVLEVDGKVPAVNAEGEMRKSYFNDTELPSSGKLTSRSGVVAFLDVPATAKSLRAVARGNVGGTVKVLGLREVPLVQDGVATAKITPFTAPKP